MRKCTDLFDSAIALGKLLATAPEGKAVKQFYQTSFDQTVSCLTSIVADSSDVSLVSMFFDLLNHFLSLNLLSNELHAELVAQLNGEEEVTIPMGSVDFVNDTVINYLPSELATMFGAIAPELVDDEEDQ